MPIEFKPCTYCGAQPQENEFRVSEDTMGVVVVCICGHSGDQIEDAYIDNGMRVDAARSWNRAN